MSKKIYRHDQCKLKQILEQVEALSDVVDELRTELNHLKKISLNENHENVCSEFINENKIDHVSRNVLQNMKAYFENIEFSTRVNEIHELAKSSQISKKEGQEPRFRFSTIYGSLKRFKNKIIKNIRSIRKTHQSAKNIKNKCVTSSQEVQHEVCLLQEEEEQKFLKFNRRNDDINNYTDISEESDNSANISSTSDASVQTDIVISQENDKKSYNCNCLTSRNITEDNEQTNPLLMTNGDRSVIHLDKFANELSKSPVRQTFLKNKIKKYKKCSCGKGCPYALYKLPCNEYKCSTPKKKIEDNEMGELTLECLSFEEKRDFPKFINVNTVRNSRSFTDSSPVKIEMDESLTSSLSVDLEVDICNDYHDLEDVDEFTKRRKARTYIVNKTRKDDLIKSSRAETEPSLNIISSWKNISEKKEKIDEIVKKILSQKRYIYAKENNQEYKKSGIRKFISNYWPIKNNNKQIQCVNPALITSICNKKVSVKTSTINFPLKKDIQLYRTTDKTRCNSFPNIIIPRRITTNIQTQVDKYLCLNCIQNKSATLINYTNKKYTKEIDTKNEEKTSFKEKNICASIEIDTSSKIICSQMKKHNICSALQTEEDINIHSNEPLSKTYDLAKWHNKIMSVRTFSWNHVSDKKIKNCTTLSSPTDYHAPSKKLHFDMNNISNKLYNCLEKLDDITTT